MGYSLKSNRPSRMRTIGAMVTNIFSVNLTLAGCEQPRVLYPAKLWDPEGRGLVKMQLLGSGFALPCPTPGSHFTHSRLRVEIPSETPEANLVKKT